MDNISYELCLYCKYENPLVNGFVAHICKSCGEEILPCSICPVLKNENTCTNCPFEIKGVVGNKE